jgi:nitrogen fixation negative regulator NifL
MHRDITEMHHLQREVVNQKNLIENIIDSAPVVMALIDMDGKPIIENKAYRLLADQAGGTEPAELFLDALREILGDDLVSACEEERQLSNFEVLLPGREGVQPRWFSCSGRWVREFELSAESYFETRRQNALLLLCNDITGLKRQVEQVRMSQVQARVAELEMGRRTNEVIEGALYQLQGPLNIMKSYVEMLRRQGDTMQPMTFAIDEALSSGHQAADALRHALSSAAPAVQAPVNINQVIRDALIISADRLSANGIVVDWRPQSALPLVYGAETELLMLLRILLENAVTAVGEPGAHGRDVRIDTQLTHDGMIEICIKDSGPGIDRSDQAKCFEPFYSGWKKCKGRSGMGLVIAKQIAGELQGDIKIDHLQRTGATVCVYLPSSKT